MDDNELRNPGWQARFTCPSCYKDFLTFESACPHCAALVECEVIDEPVSVCRLREAQGAGQ